MKQFIFIFLLSISSFSGAKENCTLNWDLSSSGIFLGQSSDHLEYKNNGLEITSKFNPSGFFSMFGVNQFNRIVKFDLNNNIIFRSEEKLGDRNEIFTWKKKENNNWQKIVNNEKEEIFNIDTRNIIDSTTLPYLAQLNTIDVLKNENNVTVLTKGKPYDAVLYSESLNKPNEKFKIFFKSEKNYGEVILNEKKQPVRLFFKDSSNSFIGKLTSITCD